MQKVVPFQGSVAQWIRRLPTEQEIVGSSPAWVNLFFTLTLAPSIGYAA